MCKDLIVRVCVCVCVCVHGCAHVFNVQAEVNTMLLSLILNGVLTTHDIFRVVHEV